jgi:tRNA U34 5-carboxymethylaminomethyl modifying GTPase MnmE/TrmE
VCSVRNASGEEVDRGLVAFFPAPHSFTGEDVVEVHLHGNPLLLAEAADAACALSARPAMPGEFSRRAFENGKMDLTQAEGLCDLIAARTAASARAALRQMKGGIRDVVAPLRERMLSLLILLEATIDFSEEEDIAPLSHAQVKERVSDIITELSGLIASYDLGHLLRDGATVAIAGVANVGRSGPSSPKFRGPRGTIFPASLRCRGCRYGWSTRRACGIRRTRWSGKGSDGAGKFLLVRTLRFSFSTGAGPPKRGTGRPTPR